MNIISVVCAALLALIEHHLAGAQSRLYSNERHRQNCAAAAATTTTTTLGRERSLLVAVPNSAATSQPAASNPLP
jgi:hypothetical protein